MNNNNFIIASNGVSNYSIVLPENPGKYIKLAAEELKDYIAKMLGAKLEISNKIKTDASQIVLKNDSTDKNKETYELICEDNKRLLIKSASDLGVLYGVYGLLEDHLGVRWYLPGEEGEYVPAKKDIALPFFTEKVKPDFEFRWIGNGGIFKRAGEESLKWAMRNRQNCCENGFTWPGIFHTQNTLLPKEKYFQEHPEYFALIDGKRSSHTRAHLCVSNPDTAKATAENISAHLDANPDISMVSFSPEDHKMYCECENCKALDEPAERDDEKYASRMLRFYNRLAEELEKTYPEVQILVGAYHWYARPPENFRIKAHKNVNVMICHYCDYCMAHSVVDESCDKNASYRNLIKAWQDMGYKILFYDYFYKVAWCDLPWPITHNMKEDFAYYRKIGAKGLYSQYSEANVWTLFPEYYVSAKLLWDHKRDPEEIMNELFDNMFLEASVPLKDCFKMLEKKMANCESHFAGEAKDFGTEIFTPEILFKMSECIIRAKELAQNEKVKLRIEKIASCFEHAKIIMNAFEKESDLDKSHALYDLYKLIASNEEKWRGIIDLNSSLCLLRLVEDYLHDEKSSLKYNEILVPPSDDCRFRLDPENQGKNEKWHSMDYDFSDWPPLLVYSELGYDHDCLTWYMRNFIVNEKIAESSIYLKLGLIPWTTEIYWNGELIMKHEASNEPLTIEIPKEKILVNSRNKLAYCVEERKTANSNKIFFY